MSNSITSRDIASRLRSELNLKLALTVLLNLAVYGPYQLLQHRHFFTARVMPASALDHLIPFSDTAVWSDLSIYTLMHIGPFFLLHRRRPMPSSIRMVL